MAQTEQSEELQLLKNRAKMMNIKFNANIGIQALKDKINNTLSDEPTDEVPETVEEATQEEVVKTPKLSARAIASKAKQARKKEMGKLIRIRLSSNNPAHKEHQGYLANVGNSEVGQYKKFIPYDTDWHVPYFVFQNLKNERFFQAFVEKRNATTGRKTKKSVIKKEFVIEELTPLTKKELSDLAQHQIANRSLDED